MRSRVEAFVGSSDLGAVSNKEAGAKVCEVVLRPEVSIMAEEPSVEKEVIDVVCSGSKKLVHRSDALLFKYGDSSINTVASMVVQSTGGDVHDLSTCMCKVGVVLVQRTCLLTESSGASRRILQHMAAFTFDPGALLYLGDGEVKFQKRHKKTNEIVSANAKS